MLKKLVLIVIVLLALAQSYFIYAVQHGADDAFAGAWSSFNVAQSGYSQFVFRTIKWWWVLPAVFGSRRGGLYFGPAHGGVS